MCLVSCVLCYAIVIELYSLPQQQVLALVLTIVIELHLKCYGEGVEINQTASARKGNQRD